MFMAVGAEAYQAGLFHMLTHAFFKALLFLSSGAVILAYHHEQNIFKMGGLFYKNKFLFACFAIGGGALAAIPYLHRWLLLERCDLGCSLGARRINRSL
jgi:NADH-quinone oxidoreductase subunit L